MTCLCLKLSTKTIKETRSPSWPDQQLVNDMKLNCSKCKSLIISFAKLSSVYPGLRAGACQVNEDPWNLPLHAQTSSGTGTSPTSSPGVQSGYTSFNCSRVLTLTNIHLWLKYLHNLCKIGRWIWLPNGTTLPQATCVKTWKGSRNDTCGLKWHWLFLACPMTGWPLPVVFKQMPIPTHKLNGRIPRKRTAVTLLNMTATLTILFEFSFINSWSYLS